MNTTWTIILCLFGFIILISGAKILFSFFKKKYPSIQSKNLLAVQPVVTNTLISYEASLFTLEAILNCNESLQKETNENIASLNGYMHQLLIDLKGTPEYLFSNHLRVVNDYVTTFIDEKLMNNSASIWHKKVTKEAMLLEAKNIELKTSNNDWNEFILKKEAEILDGWKNGNSAS